MERKEIIQIMGTMHSRNVGKEKEGVFRRAGFMMTREAKATEIETWVVVAGTMSDIEKFEEPINALEIGQKVFVTGEPRLLPIKVKGVIQYRPTIILEDLEIIKEDSYEV